MKKVITIMACAYALVAFALEADYHDEEQSAPMLTPELETAAAQLFGEQQAQMLLHAVRLQMAKYDNDMRTDSGRRAWHGDMVGQIVDTNSLEKVTVYSNKVNGAVWRFRQKFRPTSVSRVRTSPTLTTNGIPARLAAAREFRNQQSAQGGTIVTNIVIGSPPMPMPGGAE